MFVSARIHLSRLALHFTFTWFHTWRYKCGFLTVFPSVCCLCSCMPSSVHVFLLQFTEVGLFETVWQVKYYNYNKRDHCQWGNSFNSIEYECKPNDTRTLMWINKEMFVWWRSGVEYIQVYSAKKRKKKKETQGDVSNRSLSRWN